MLARAHVSQDIFVILFAYTLPCICVELCLSHHVCLSVLNFWNFLWSPRAFAFCEHLCQCVDVGVYGGAYVCVCILTCDCKCARVYLYAHLSARRYVCLCVLEQINSCYVCFNVRACVVSVHIIVCINILLLSLCACVCEVTPPVCPHDSPLFTNLLVTREKKTVLQCIKASIRGHFC